MAGELKENEDVYERIDKFHAHLDICSQCEHHPFNLCSTGAQLLREAATGAKGGKQKWQLNK